jgi:hypothetical protein
MIKITKYTNNNCNNNNRDNSQVLTDRARATVAEELACDAAHVALVDNATQASVCVCVASGRDADGARMAWWWWWWWCLNPLLVVVVPKPFTGGGGA